LANLSFFFTYDSPAVRRYHLDLAALHASAKQIADLHGPLAAANCWRVQRA
jgi:hypothetical protein